MPNAPSPPGPPPPQCGSGEPPGGSPAGGTAAAPGERFRALVDALPNLAFETDAHGAMRWCSAGWERFTGLAASGLNGQGWLRVVHPQDLATHAAEWAQRLGSGVAFSVRRRLRRHDGPWRWHLVQLVPMPDAAGRQDGWVGSATDVDEMLAAEHAARAQVESMLGAISDAFYALDREWRFSYVNDRALALLGVAREALLGRVVWEAYAPVLGTVVEHEYRRAMAQGVPVAFEIHYPPLGMWFDVRAFPSPQGLAVYFQDVTARREAAERLRTNEQLLQAIFDAAPVGLVVAEAPSGRLVKGNRQIERILGHPVMAVDGVQDYGAYAALHPDGTPLLPGEHVMARALAGEGRPELEHLYQRPDGHRAWIRVVGAPIRDGTGAVTGALVVLDDIDDKRRALESLQERTRQLAQAQLRLDMALAAGRMGVWEWLPQAGESRWNREMFELLGLPVSPGGVVASEAFLSRVHAEDRPLLDAALARALDTGGSFELEFRLHCADGRQRWVLGRGQAVCGEQGEVQRMVGVNLDITAQKAAQAALAEALQAREVLLYELNHRVKNNLQIVSSLLSLQLRSVRDADARRAIEQAGARVGVMARLHLELYQSGRHGELDLARWLRRLAQDQLRLLGQGRAIALDYQADTTLSLAVDQAVPLSLMVSELLSNALKYAFPDGRGGTVRLQLRRAGQGVQLLVADDGVGLPPQLDPETGTGLGLRIVQALAGQIDARLELLERRAGVAFRIELPIAGEAAAG
ncbi:PAS domain S-box protein [Azohydromonas australica]|uniref:PAS domain S-box protein n=1 Tax=Azohydromonas australica TaxID=364039 RepID=UPI00042619B5|nr:PAS domain S-box protein [Azohydromonas australica]